MRIRIENAALFDPARGLSGERGELFIDAGRIVERIAKPDLVIDAQEGPALAGGIELGAALASPLMVHMMAAGHLAPLRDAAGAYTRLGYTHLNVRGVPLWAAGAAHYWLGKLGALDVSVEPLLNLSDLDLLIKEDGGVERGLGHAAFLMSAGLGIGLSVGEPFVRYRKEYLSFRQASVPECLGYVVGLARGLGLRLSVAYFPELAESLTQDIARWIHLAGVSKEAALDLEDFFKAGGTADIEVAGPRSRLGLEAGLFSPLNARRGEPLLPPDGTVALAGLPESGDAKTLSEVLKGADPAGFALATRTIPATGLGLSAEKGTLGPGSVADVAIFGPERDLTRCRYLFKSGVLVVDDYQPTGLSPETRTYCFATDVPPEPAGDIPGSLRRENLSVSHGSFSPIKEVRRDVGG